MYLELYLLGALILTSCMRYVQLVDGYLLRSLTHLEGGRVEGLRFVHIMGTKEWDIWASFVNNLYTKEINFKDTDYEYSLAYTIDMDLKYV